MDSLATGTDIPARNQPPGRKPKGQAIQELMDAIDSFIPLPIARGGQAVPDVHRLNIEGRGRLRRVERGLLKRWREVKSSIA